jgi:hypothetical protein
MSTYISIDESYSVRKFKNLTEVLEMCNRYYTQSGKAITKEVIAIELKEFGQLNLYSYDEDELQEAQEDGSVIGIDWQYKIQKI